MLVGWKSTCPPPHDSREELGGDLHSVCEAEKRMAIPIKIVYGVFAFWVPLTGGSSFCKIDRRVFENDKGVGYTLIYM